MLRCVLILILLACMGVAPTRAATPAVDEAIKTLESLRSDATKLKAYCAVFEEFVAAGDDEAKQTAVEEKMTKLLNSFGPQYQRFWQVYQETDPSSDDGQSLDAAFLKLDEKCEG